MWRVYVVLLMFLHINVRYSTGQNIRLPFHFEKQDPNSSPQFSISERYLLRNSSQFVEGLPPGKFHLNDALLSAEQTDNLFVEKPIVIGRAIINDNKLRWTDATIPYEFDCSIEKLENAVYAIKAAMQEWETKTCIRFKKRTNEKMYLRFIRDTHCWGHVGMHDYSTISCGFGCEQQNVMAHEIGHAVGFYHEQNRKDRDSWVQVMWNNIGKFKDAFKKVKNTYSLGVRYDYESIMHYPWSAFSSTGQDTMRPLNNRYNLQPYVKISQADIQQTSLMYKCRGRRRVSDEIEYQLKEAGIDINDESSLFDAGCVDQHMTCAEWKKAGYCELYTHVTKFCKKSCNHHSCGVNGCVDKNEHCSSWQKEGYCDSSKYVKENCCLSCNRGPRPTKATTTTSTTTTTTTTTINPTTTKKRKKCTDERAYCRAWAKKGFCKASSKWAGFMKDKCCLTCSGQKSCVNKREYCDAWSNIGYCKRTSEFYGFMRDNCCLSCRGPRPSRKPTTTTTSTTAPPTTTTTTTTTPPPPTTRRTTTTRRKKYCTDKGKYCKQWSAMGYCKPSHQYYGYMKDNCCASCQGKTTPQPVTMKPVTTSKPVEPTLKPKRIYLGTGVLCEDTRNDCPSLAQRGECTRNRAWMEYYCKKSCRMNCDQPGMRPPNERCANPLGLSYGSRNSIPDSAITSERGYLTTGGWNAYPYNARLYFPDDATNKRIGGWCANTGEVTPQTMQAIKVDLGRRKRVTHIATQGRDKYFERISQFKLEYSDDGYTFNKYTEKGKDRIFIGSCDYRTPVLNKFANPITARYIKYVPWKWNYPCVRMEYYGCDV